MLTEITIKDFAIIDELQLQFAPGFNVLTGETGAGKSIILDAVSLLMGARAETVMVRAGANMALVEGVFALTDDPEVVERVRSVLREEALEGDDERFVVITREVKRNGRSVARVNGRTTTVAAVQTVGEALVDIHGQGDYLSLMKPETHLELIDRYAGLVDQRRSFAKLVKRIEKVRRDLKDRVQNEEMIQARVEMLTFKVKEIEAAKLKPAEVKALEEEARLLANAEQLAELTATAYSALYTPISDEGFSTVDLLAEAAGALSRLRKIDPETGDLADLAESLSVQAEELSRSLADYQETIEFDPARLQHIELRLDLINQLKRKYNCDTVEDLLEDAAEASQELENIGESDKLIAQLEAEEARLLTEIGAAGVALSSARSTAAAELADKVENELNELRMSSARFGVSIEQQDDPMGAPVGDYRVAFDQTGIDRIEFMLAPNPGEPFKAMSRIASGGETSRIMLALKTVLSRADSTPTLIFDEIDTGIGGRIGAIVGEKLWSLSDKHQVMVVTHLPQLAGFADTHFKVEKHIKGDRTLTHVWPLEAEKRIDELSQMLGAESESSRRNAMDILDYVQQIKGAVSAG